MYVPLAHVTVQDSIEPTPKVWKASLIYTLFDQNIAQLILNTPLQPLVREDRLI